MMVLLRTAEVKNDPGTRPERERSVPLTYGVEPVKTNRKQEIVCKDRSEHRGGTSQRWFLVRSSMLKQSTRLTKNIVKHHARKMVTLHR